MSHHNSIQSRQPKKVRFQTANNGLLDSAPGNIPVPLDHKLLIAGQGCLVFTIPQASAQLDNVHLTFSTQEGAAVRLTLNTSKAIFQYRHQASATWQSFELLNPETAVINPKDGYHGGIDLNQACRYWVSIDSLNKRLRYGKGEMRLSTALLDYQYDQPKNLFNKDENSEYTFINGLKDFEVSEAISLMTLWKDPVVIDPPVLVVPSSEFTMDAAAAATETTPTSLSKECQILYGNVADFQLNTPDFPDFEQAIEYSIRTEGCIGNQILKKKLADSPFDSGTEQHSPEDYKEVYLRITLGYSQGESPGIPYVMEIWPVGCASPVHHHGYTHAIIKVLRGSIDVDLYRMLPTEYSSNDPLQTATFHPNEVTYLMPEVNQYHLLKNNLNNSDTCITIQCYSYAQDDDQHYATFDYVENDELGHFDPISDYDFLAFKQKVKEEWTAFLNKKFWMEEALESVN